ncbi:NfeD family protein [Pontibacter akesuensis]|uniref:NfeD family protein n=1 Tax=Pontibacter akesuensis TaxID=388950 RepID=UPI001E5B1E1D|nr:NfeD family protein [Pontibacter akesuensis]
MILLIGVGLLLVIVELIFVPGTTVVGILGFILTGIGIWIGYASLGSDVGHIILGATVLVAGVAVVYSFKTNSWARFALKEQNRGHVNEDTPHLLAVGEEGVAVSALRPQGTALFADRHHEVQTQGEYITPNTAIRIIKLNQNQITVEAIS